MTQENKQVLLIDLCARFPYGVKVRTFVGGEIRNDKKELSFVQISLYKSGFEDIKPYLFPLSSMTLRQKQELDTIVGKKIYREINYHECIKQMIDFYHKHHLDYRGLIPMGLALDATELNIY